MEIRQALAGDLGESLETTTDDGTSATQPPMIVVGADGIETFGTCSEVDDPMGMVDPMAGMDPGAGADPGASTDPGPGMDPGPGPGTDPGMGGTDPGLPPDITPPPVLPPVIVSMDYEWTGTSITVFGQVIDDGPLDGLLVEFDGLLANQFTFTDEDGAFSITVPVTQTFGQIGAIVTDDDGLTSMEFVINVL